MDRVISEITRWYDLTTANYRSDRRFEQIQEEMKQQSWELRTRSKAEKEYKGSLRSILDKLTGKGDRLEILQRETQEAKARFEKTVWEWQRLSAGSVELQKQCDTLPSLEELKARAQAYPEAVTYLAQREVTFCAQMLLPLLEENRKALEEYHQQLRGDRMGEIATVQRLHEIGTAHIQWGDQCAALLRRMEPSMNHLEKPFEIPGYFLSPNAYIVSKAAKHNQLERMNQALQQVETVYRETEKLLKAE